jgi:hypothetical protein
MSDKGKHYPDISDILAQKAEWRRRRASLSFAEKLVIMDELRERVRPVAQAREARRRKRSPGDAQG